MKTPDPTIPVRAGEALDETALAAYLRGQAPTMGNLLEIRQFPGGFSNLTYCLHTSTGAYVLRRPPFGANIKGGHDMGREYRVLSLLQAHYDKIPKPIVFCDDESVLGAPFYIMERLEGNILRPANALKMALAPAVLRQASEVLVDNLVALHRLDIHRTGLAALGKPEGYVQRQVEGWIKRYYNAQTDDLQDMKTIEDWLLAHPPREQAPTFLHNDYKYDNVVFQPDNWTRIIGVLDWEMATVGDPLMDLGATLAYWIEPTDSAFARQLNSTWLPGNLNRQEVIERYAAQSGRDLSDILFYYVFGLYKNTVIAQQIYARWKKGYTQDPRFGELIGVIRDFAGKGVGALAKGEVK